MFIRLLPFLKSRFMTLFFALLLLSGCGQPSLSRNTPQLPTSIPAAYTSPTPEQPSLGTSIAFDLGGWIHVQSGSGFTCGVETPHNPPGLLTFSTTQSTYDQGTLQPVQNYVTSLLANGGDVDPASNHRDTVPYPAFPANLSGFQLAAVSDTKHDCNEILHITNIKNMPIQIKPASVTLTADAQTNNLHYHLIEGCSLVGLIPGCSGQYGGKEDEYAAGFALHPGKTHATIPADTINALTLQPGEVAKVILYYYTAPSSNFSFSLIPSFSIGLSGGQATTYPVPQLQETLAFALPSQFSCYDLQGQQFVEASADQAENWCI
jgi:hypothetical protein